MEYSVSILIPTYNRANLIERAINSSLKQTFKCEIIVCDHGSNDDTYKICKSYGNKIRYIRREIDYGLHFCEIEALLAATGNLIHFCFDDDWIHPLYIEDSIKFFNEKIGMVFCEHELINLNKDLKNLKKWTLPSHYEVKRLNTLTGLPKVMKDISDRNRTSPVAFTGNKFELRALGSSANGSDAAKIMNMLCAYGYEQLIAKLEKKKGDVKKNALIILKDVLKDTKNIRFECNNYADSWKYESKKLKLFVVNN